jgi:hypothetical protein
MPEQEISDVDYIIKYLIPEWDRLFKQKNKDYGSDNWSLGPKAIFVDIWRKVHKLKRGLWDGKPLVYEQPRELLMDIIGHCFLAIAKMDKENGGNIRPPRPMAKGVIDDIGRENVLESEMT